MSVSVEYCGVADPPAAGDEVFIDLLFSAHRLAGHGPGEHARRDRGRGYGDERRQPVPEKPAGAMPGKFDDRRNHLAGLPVQELAGGGDALIVAEELDDVAPRIDGLEFEDARGVGRLAV